MKNKVESMRRRMGPVGLSLLAAALTAAAFAAVSTAAKDDGNKQKGGEPPVFEQRLSPPPELSAEDQQKLEEFRQCMQDNGAPAPPDPGEMHQRFRSGEMPEPPGAEEIEKLRKAHEACADKLPEGMDLRFHAGPGGPAGPGCGGPGGPPHEEGTQEGTSAPAPSGRAQGDVLYAPSGASS
jgi:hypothetical protein